MQELRWPPGIVRLLGSFTLVVGLSLGSSSCFFKKPPRAFNPPALPPAPRVPVIPPDPISAPPDVLASVDPGLPTDPVELPAIPGPPAPPPVKRPPVATAPKQAPNPPQPSNNEPTPVAPRLGQLFTDEQKREYNRSFEESLAKVRRALVTLGGRTLNADQVRIVDSIKSLQKQAEQSHDDDLAAAVNLAKRADVLASDLLQALAR